MPKTVKTLAEETIVGNSNAVRRLRNFINKAGEKREDILLVGERGVGKTLVAQAIHEATPKASKIKICSPLSLDEKEIQSLITADFTNIGTIVIRELEEYSILQQTLLARFIEKYSSHKSSRVIITLKNDPDDLLSAGKLNKDLCRHLKEYESIMIPSLKDRPEDIPYLVDHFVRTTCERLDISVKTLDINTIDILSKRTWHGNARELKEMIENAVLSTKGEIIELPHSVLDEHGQLDGILKNIDDRKNFAFDKALSNIECALIERALEATGYNQTKAAGVLGISGANFRYRLRKYKIPRKPR